MKYMNQKTGFAADIGESGKHGGRIRAAGNSRQEFGSRRKTGKRFFNRRLK